MRTKLIRVRSADVVSGLLESKAVSLSRSLIFEASLLSPAAKKVASLRSKSHPMPTPAVLDDGDW